MNNWKNNFTKKKPKLPPGYYWSEKFQTYLNKEGEALLEKKLSEGKIEQNEQKILPE